MYTIDQVMQVVYANPGFAVTAAFLTYGFGFVQYGASMFMQVRNQRCPFYFWMRCWYFGHDITFSLLFHQWFAEIGYWLFEVLCVGCMCFVLIELFSLYQSVVNERDEIWGRYRGGRPVTEREAWIRGVACYMMGALLFCCIRLIIGDVTCLILMASTNAILALMVHFRYEEIGVRQPGTILLAWATLFGTLFTFAPRGVGFFATLIAPLDTPAYYAVGALCALAAARAVWLAHTLPATVKNDPTDATKEA